jgi:flagella synthesis protein FlgN
VSVDIEGLLKQQQTVLTEVCSLLKRELEAVVQRDTEGLLSLLEDKKSLLSQVEETDRLLNQALSSAPSKQPYQALIDSIQSLVEDCKHLSSINEKAVTASQTRLKHLQDLLVQGRQRESMTYDKAGRVSGGTLSKGIKA